MDRKQSFKKPELLAPAGDLARLKTAVRYGADAVYLGGRKYSLRSRASNFSMDDIREACAFAGKYHARIHVTVNEIPHEEDYEGLSDYLKELQDAGVTAVIVASPSIMALAKKTAPKLQVHCSTQMSVTNAAAAQYLYQTLHIDRVVPARECTLDEIRALAAHSPVETEAFIHGGMCVNYSGRCVLSNRMTLRDANRGGCAQSCRWSYRLFENDIELSKDHLPYTMGSKDLCAAAYIGELMKAGVASFKIEGRMKTEYYVACIVSAYRHLIDELYESGCTLSKERLDYHMKQIMKGENREVCTGFYGGIAGSDSIIAHENSNDHVNHSFLATVKSYDAEKGTMIIETRNPFSLNETIEVLEPGISNRTFTLEEIQNEKGEYLDSSRSPMALLKVRVPFAVKENDILRQADDH